MNLSVFVATHKRTNIPSDDVYVPIRVGSVLHDDDFGYIRDDRGDNISLKNKSFCELTAIYWAWKNCDSDYIGLVHYRRYFTKGILFGKSAKWRGILDKNDWYALLSKYDVIVPKRRNYYIETNKSQYEHAHNPNDLKVVEDIITEFYPSYIAPFHHVLDRTWGHRFNMFVMKKELLAAYCKWLFDVLFKLEQRIDISTYNDYNMRIFGFMSERLFDVWLETNNIKYKEVSVSFMESQNWFKKGWKFMDRKIRGGIKWTK